MANIKSAKKRIKVIETKTARNKAAKSKLKTILKKFDQAVASGDKAAAEAQLKVCTSEISKAASKEFFIRTQHQERFLVYQQL